MKIYTLQNKPKKFKYRMCNYQPRLQDLDSVTETFKREEYVIIKEEDTYAVFVECSKAMSAKEELEHCRANKWAKKKVREGR